VIWQAAENASGVSGSACYPEVTQQVSLKATC